MAHHEVQAVGLVLNTQRRLHVRICRDADALRPGWVLVEEHDVRIDKLPENADEPEMGEIGQSQKSQERVTSFVLLLEIIGSDGEVEILELKRDTGKFLSLHGLRTELL